MGFHIEHRGDNGVQHRSGTHDTLAGAIGSAVRLPFRPVVILEAADGLVQLGGGTLAGAVLDDGSVVERPDEPTWWGALAGGIRERLLENVDGSLDAEAVAAITHAGGTATLTYWNDDPSTGDGFRLNDSAVDWLQAERARRMVIG